MKVLICTVVFGLLGFVAINAQIHSIAVDELFSDGQIPAWNHDGLRAIPVSPENLTITVINSTDVRITWQPVTQDTGGMAFTPDGYKVYYTTDPAPTSNNYAFLAATTATYYDHLGVVDAHEFMFYYVVAFKESMILVTGGTFYNGVSDVTISSFYIDKYELTQDTFQAVMGFNTSYFTNVTEGPTERTTWFNAIEYCNRRSLHEALTPCYSYSTYGTNPDNWPSGWNTINANHNNVSCDWTATGYRLPTEMEWMFAAMGGNLPQGFTYSGSNDIDAVAWYVGNSGETTHAVGSLAANQLGIFDMSGNVWEWCWDIYADYPAGPQIDPHGPDTGSYRVARGGSWGSAAMNCAVAHRNYYAISSSHYHMGFRVCRIP